MQMNPNGNNKGVSIIEILVVIFIINTTLVSLLSLAVFSLKTSTFIKETNQTAFLAQEVMEAVRNFRDGTVWDTDGLGNLTSGAAYHPEKSSDVPPKWQLILGEETVNGFTRKIEFEEVYRDGNDNIVDSGGTNDPDTKKATVTISWKDKEVKIATYFTNWR
jgi:type II secretory pathway pseudopilin PulG